MNRQIIQKDRNMSFAGQYAGFVSRLVAFIIDIVIISFILITSSWFISTSINLFRLDNVFDSFSKQLPFVNSIRNIIFNPISASLVSLLVILSYNIFFWTFSGSSPGKSIMGIRIVPLNGKKISLWRGLLRYLGYYISAIPFGLGFLWIIIDNRRMAWHDKLSRTCVIYIWDAQPDELFLKSQLDHLALRRDVLQTYVKKHKIQLDSKDKT
jgi:uncharacterized RDD family membrane protein YckC